MRKAKLTEAHNGLGDYPTYEFDMYEWLDSVVDFPEWIMVTLVGFLKGKL
jgi:hypothetical protein